MDFRLIAKNWLAIHGNFKQFDYSIFTNSGISKSLYNDFCFYAAGFQGIPELGITPEEQMTIVSDYLAGTANTKIETASILKCCSLLGFKTAQCGSLALERPKGTKVSTIKMQDALLKYVLDPENQLISAQLADGNEIQLTLPQFLLYDHISGINHTVDDLLKLNLIQFCKVDRTPQVYLIGSIFYSSLSDEECKEILHNVYTILLNLIDKEFATNAGDFTLLSLNECTGKGKKSVQKAFLKQIVKANALGFSLNQIMNCAGLNIPDVLYSMKEFGTPTAINENDEGIQFVSANAKVCTDSNDMFTDHQIVSKKDTIRITEDKKKLAKFEGNIDLFIDKDQFLQNFGGANEPREIKIS